MYCKNANNTNFKRIKLLSDFTRYCPSWGSIGYIDPETPEEILGSFPKPTQFDPVLLTGRHLGDSTT